MTSDPGWIASIIHGSEAHSVNDEGHRKGLLSDVLAQKGLGSY